MRPSTVRAAVLIAVLLVVIAGAAVFAFGALGSRQGGAGTTPAVSAPATSAPGPAAASKPTAATQANPTIAAKAPAQPKPSGPADVDRARIVSEATWTPGQLQDHFQKHGREGPWASESVYDASARETVTVGALFTYVDGATNAERLGFFDKAGNRFTSVTQDGRRITTHFRPDRGESYVRNLYRSTYR